MSTDYIMSEEILAFIVLMCLNEMDWNRVARSLNTWIWVLEYRNWSCLEIW